MKNPEKVSEALKPLVNFLENKETKKEVTSVIENSLKVVSNAIPALIDDGIFQETASVVSDGLATAYTKLAEYFDAVQDMIEETAGIIEGEKKKFALKHPGKTVKIIAAWNRVKKSVAKLGEAAYATNDHHVSTRYKSSAKASNEEMKNPAEAAAEEMKAAAEKIASKHNVTGTGFIGGF